MQAQLPILLGTVVLGLALVALLGVTFSVRRRARREQHVLARGADPLPRWDDDGGMPAPAARPGRDFEVRSDGE